MQGQQITYTYCFMRLFSLIKYLIFTMKRNNQLLEKRNRDIRDRYNELYNKERKRHDDVMAELEQQFYLSQRTISAIVFPKGKTPVKRH